MREKIDYKSIYDMQVAMKNLMVDELEMHEMEERIRSSSYKTKPNSLNEKGNTKSYQKAQTLIVKNQI